MKQFVLLIVILAATVLQALAARICPTTGRVVDPHGQGIGYASVVLLRGTEQQAGMSTDENGCFELKAPAGEYTLVVQFLGYESAERQVRIEERNDLGDIVLTPSATDIEGVVVEAQLIRREADRFVVDVANSPAAIGKDGIELLERAPGIWINDDKITINGKSGSKVYINDRELRMQPEQLLVYLRSLRAEEIQKIEVVPTTGADYDADSSGGIIKITLKRRRENGMQGSLSLRTNQSKYQNTYVPAGDIAYHRGRLDLGFSGWGYLGDGDMASDEQTLYTESEKSLRAHSTIPGTCYNGGIRANGIYEFDDRHSIGAEFSYDHRNDRGDTRTTTAMTDATATTTIESRYISADRSDSYGATFNYIWKIDTLGSTLKALGDYSRRRNSTGNDNSSRIAPPAPAQPVDSLYRDATGSVYEVAALTLALEKHFSQAWSLKAGAKYTRNDMRNDALYEYRRGDAWLRNDAQSFEVNYVENIAALYGILSANVGRWSFVAGVRGEYTATHGRKSEVGQNYFSLFPNANVSLRLSDDGAYSLVAQYARTLSRPNFWSLSPRRMQISDYTYQIGNPELDPSYRNDLSMTLVMKHKYTLTAGMIVATDDINQTMMADADNPDMLSIRWVNYDRTRSYYLAANLPFQPTKWWQLNLGANYVRQGQRLDQHAPETYQHIVFANAASTFTLPAKCYIDLSYQYQGDIRLGAVTVKGTHRLNASLKKRFGERFTASLTVSNLLNEHQTVVADDAAFRRTVLVEDNWNYRSCSVSVSYNFKAGKAFRNKSIESAAAEDKGRM